jgi:hypothetical protein
VFIGLDWLRRLKFLHHKLITASEFQNGRISGNFFLANTIASFNQDNFLEDSREDIFSGER